jgi:hypothetical protein
MNMNTRHQMARFDGADERFEMAMGKGDFRTAQTMADRMVSIAHDMESDADFNAEVWRHDAKVAMERVWRAKHRVAA